MRRELEVEILSQLRRDHRTTLNSFQKMLQIVGKRTRKAVAKIQVTELWNDTHMVTLYQIQQQIIQSDK